jgi:hypothetical protein
MSDDRRPTDAKESGTLFGGAFGHHQRPTPPPADGETLVARLRMAAAHDCIAYPVAQLYREAADEIERLQRELAEARGDVTDAHQSRELLAKRLDEVCLALKGEPPPLTMYSWHDLGPLASEWKARAEAAERELSTVRADAERYRWLRDADNWTEAGPMPCVATFDSTIYGAKLDAAIDAAR